MTLRILSFGAGVQSSAVARMSLIGEIEPFDHVIFADTGDEPAAVYDNVAWWVERFRSEGVEFHIVGRPSSIAADLRLVVTGQITSAKNPPLFVVNPDGSHGMVRRKCTRDHKVAPIQAKLKQILGFAGRRHNHITDIVATQTLGISWDETQRMRDSEYSWLAHEYPLVDMRLTRSDCLAAITADPDFPNPVRSACWHCPFHSDEEWRHLRDNDPESFAKAVALDADIRTGRMLTGAGLVGTPYLHRSRKPLSEVDFDNEEDKGQLVLWGNECEGMCGL